MNSYWLKTKFVSSDDYGDTQWNYYCELYKGKKLIWNDYYREQPTLKKVLSELDGVITAKERLEYLRQEIENETISYSEIADLQELAEYIQPDDVLLLQWAGVEEATA